MMLYVDSELKRYGSAMQAALVCKPWGPWAILARVGTNELAGRGLACV